jgi:Mrp family chromosome partitioning ATPase
VDGILLVVNAASVTRKALTDAADQIRKAGGNIIGAVMNAVDAKDGYGYYYQNYYADYVRDADPASNGVASIEPEVDIFGATSDGTDESDPIEKADSEEPSEETR